MLTKSLHFLVFVLIWIGQVNVGLGAVGAQFHIDFPQIAAGTAGGVKYDSFIVITNPGVAVLNVSVVAVDLNGKPFFGGNGIMNFDLQPGQTRRIEIGSDTLRAGWASVTSSKIFSGAVHINARSAFGSGANFSQVTILGQSPGAKVVVPTFFGVAGVSASSTPENTGVAIVGTPGIDLQLTLRDSDGILLGSRLLRLTGVPAGYKAAFINELFPELAGAHVGSLTIEHNGTIPYAFSATALYVLGQQFWSAPVTMIDVPRSYLVRPKTNVSVDQATKDLSTQYGFTVTRIGIGDFSASMTDEVARAVARDPRIELVEPNALGQPLKE